MSRVMKYSALVFLLAAGVLMANSDGPSCRMFIVDNLGEVTELPCTGIGTAQPGEYIIKITDGKDGFHAEVACNAERYEFDDRDSFEAFLNLHPRLKDCVGDLYYRTETDYDIPVEHSDDTRNTE